MKKRICKNCGKELSEKKRSHAVYCTRVCKKNANYKARVSDPVKKKACLERAAKWRKENPERAKSRVSEWQKVNRGRCNAISMKYIASKIRATPDWLTKYMLEEIRDIYWVASDLSKVSPDNYHVDHIVPLQGNNVCGLHVPWNLQVLPSDINIAKRNTHEGFRV